MMRWQRVQREPDYRAVHVLSRHPGHVRTLRVDVTSGVRFLICHYSLRGDFLRGPPGPGRRSSTAAVREMFEEMRYPY